MIDLLLLLSVLVWPLGQLFVIPIQPGVNVAILDCLAILIAINLFLWRKTRQSVINDTLFKPLMIFDLVLLLSLLFSPTLVAFMYWLRFVVYGGFYFAFRNSHVSWQKWLTLSGTIFLVLGFAQYLLLPDMRFLYYLGFDDHLYRLVGTLLDPNYVGLLLVLMSLVSLMSFRGKYKLLTIIPLLALALTFSRASFLTLGFGLTFLAVRMKKYTILGVVLILALFVYLIPKPFGEGVNLTRTFSIQSRLTNQEQAVGLFLQKPILGQGFGGLKAKQGTVRQFDIPVHIGGVDNSFLFVLATTGVVGIVTFIYLLWSIGKRLWPSPLLSTLFVVILFHSLFNNSFFYSWILGVLWLVIASAGDIYKSGKSIKHISKGRAQKHVITA